MNVNIIAKNRVKCLVIYFILIIVIWGCKKGTNGGGSSAPVSINVFNAIPGSAPIIPVFGTFEPLKWFSSATRVYYGNVYLFSPVGGSNDLYIVQNTDTILSNSKGPLFSGSLNLQGGSIYSFFLSGDTVNTDTVLVQDKIPIYSDSSVGVRFINLVSGSLPMSVNIHGNVPADTEFYGLAYKSVSMFKKYSASSLVPGGYYKFEIRDEQSGTLLTTFSWSFTRFKCNTLVISGSELPGFSTPLQVYQMNNY
ncbi:DUF4397 domain-containing protein [Dinghuibacter silviterrae]|uniref:DUF4397 domain-containing protein n=1 Tax=Dinghuibacter silviterrae TaxID=1539049 RepID=A0A4R8DWM4_9BACT|nr:DUF4397 domain-containing protein [Dinghuibacter silviterrae]TDX01827.1 hypothetical protein EDB95_2870 [Dinghuibacter silviterrae]